MMKYYNQFGKEFATIEQAKADMKDYIDRTSEGDIEDYRTRKTEDYVPGIYHDENGEPVTDWIITTDADYYELAGLFVADFETGTFIEQVSSIEEGEKLIKAYEEQDKKDGVYEEGFYDIVLGNHASVIR